MPVSGSRQAPCQVPPAPPPPPTRRGVHDCEASGCKSHREPRRDISHDLSHYLEGTKNRSPAGDGLEKPRDAGLLWGGGLSRRADSVLRGSLLG